MTFDDVTQFIYQQWQQPEKKYAFLAAALTAVVVPLGTSLTILPILGAITVAAIGAYVATNIIQYAVSFFQKLKQTLDHVDETIIKLNQEVVPRVDKVLDGVQKTIDKSDKAVDDLHALVGKIDTTVETVNTTTMPEIDKALAQVQTGTIPEVNKAIAKLQENTMSSVDKTLGDLRTTVQEANAVMSQVSGIASWLPGGRRKPSAPEIPPAVVTPTPAVETAPDVEAPAITPLRKARGRKKAANQQEAAPEVIPTPPPAPAASSGWSLGLW